MLFFGADMVKPMSNGGPPEISIVRFDVFRTKARVTMTTLACSLVLYSIRAICDDVLV